MTRLMLPTAAVPMFAARLVRAVRDLPLAPGAAAEDDDPAPLGGDPACDVADGLPAQTAPRSGRSFTNLNPALTCARQA
jgi:hypothetical protein